MPTLVEPDPAFQKWIDQGRAALSEGFCPVSRHGRLDRDRYCTHCRGWYSLTDIGYELVKRA